jgi:hypothetical protein
MLRRLRHRLRIWRLRRASKWYYDESIAHRNYARLHQRAIWRCLALGNEHRDLATRLEAEEKA